MKTFLETKTVSCLKKITANYLFIESCDGIKRSSELAKQCGYQKRNRELLSWAKRKRTVIHREDLLAYLSGKPPPPRHNNHHNHHRWLLIYKYNASVFLYVFFCFIKINKIVATTDKYITTTKCRYSNKYRYGRWFTYI